MDSKYPVRLSKAGLDFLDKINTNRIRAGVADKAVSRSDTLEIVAKYFKSNNDRNLEMIKTSGEKNE